MDKYLEREFTNLEELLGFYSGRLVSYPLIPPEHVYFALTNRCCLKCAMCDIAKTPSKIEDELSTPKIKEIIFQIKDLGVKHLIFSGGEPLLREDLLEILEFSISIGIRMVDVITNGILFDENMIQKLIKIKLNHITVSLDGLKETNDEIRGEGSFEKSANNIDKLNYYKEKFNSFFPTVGINFTIMNKNIDDILKIIEFARNKKCNIVVFQPVLFSNTRMHEKRKNILWPSEANILKLKEILYKVATLKNTLKDLNIYTDAAVLRAIPDYFKGRRPGNNFKCYEGIKRIVITYDGKVWSCMGICGDLKKDNLKNIWFSKKAMIIRERVKRCKAHCLQDCVYFPSNISEPITNLLKQLGNKSKQEKEKVKEKLLKIVEYYTDILSTRKIGRGIVSLFKNIDFKIELNKLYSIKKNIEGY